MKEEYFTEEFIREIRTRYLKPKKWEKIQPFKRATVLAIDLQKYFLSTDSPAYLPSSPFFIPRLRKFYTKVEALGVPVIFTRHYHVDGIMRRWWGRDMPKNDPFNEILDDFKPFAKKVIEKNTYDAFYNTSLEEELKRFEVETIVITGVMTHLCCETTARSAFVRGFNVIFPVDGSITQNALLHEGTVRSLSHGFAVTPLLEEVLEWLSSE